MNAPKPGESWFAVNVNAWIDAADMLTRAGEPWPWRLIMADLRWWADRERMGRGTRPGRPSLRKRWNVSDRTVRKALKAEDEWQDPRHRADSERTAGGQPASSPAPASVEDCTGGGQRADSGRTADVPTRGIHRTQDTGHIDPPTFVRSEPGQDAAPAPAEPKPDKAGALWAELQTIRQQYAPKATGKHLTQKRRTALIARTRELKAAGMDLDDLRRAAHWMHTSDRPQARGAQSTGDPISTLLRTRCVEYCEAARDDEDGAAVEAVSERARPEDESGAIWTRVITEIGNLGPSDACQGAPPRVQHALKAAGGAHHLARLGQYEQGAARRTFCDAYRSWTGDNVVSLREVSK